MLIPGNLGAYLCGSATQCEFFLVLCFIYLKTQGYCSIYSQDICVCFNIKLILVFLIIKETWWFRKVCLHLWCACSTTWHMLNRSIPVRIWAQSSNLAISLSPFFHVIQRHTITINNIFASLRKRVSAIHTWRFSHEIIKEFF